MPRQWKFATSVSARPRSLIRRPPRPEILNIPFLRPDRLCLGRPLHWVTGYVANTIYHFRVGLTL